MELQELKKRYSLDEFTRYLPDLKIGKNVHCPFHDDKNPSLSIFEGENGEYFFRCYGCNEKGDIITFKAKREDITTEDAIKCFRKRYNGKASEEEIVDQYDYTDEDGNLLYQVVRLYPKNFRQRRPDGKGGWEWKTKDTRRVLYRLPEVLKAETVFIVEGEKDVDALRKRGLTATCNPMGAGKWFKKYNYDSFLKDKNVIILPDNDEAGRNHAQMVSDNVMEKAQSVKVVQLPGLPDKGDASDWLKAGGTEEQLLALVQETEEWKPKEDTETIEVNTGQVTELKNTIEQVTPDSKISLIKDLDLQIELLNDSNEKKWELRNRLAAKHGFKYQTLLSKIIKYEASQTDTEEDPKRARKSKPSKVDELIRLTEHLPVYKTHDHIAVIRYEVDNHMETRDINSSRFQVYLRKLYYEHQGKGISDTSLKEVAGTLIAKALYEGEPIKDFLRIAHHDGRIYIDLSDEDWKCVEVTKDSGYLCTTPQKGKLSLK